MAKIIEGAQVFVLIYYDPDQDPYIVSVFGSKEKAQETKREKNRNMSETECFDENGDFDYDNYDTCDYGYYDILQFDLII